MPKDVAVFSNRKRKQTKNLQRTLSKNSKAENAIKSLQQSFDYINAIGSFFGIRSGCEVKINFRLLCSISLLLFTWIQFIYSQIRYLANGEHMRILEVFALYGCSVSCSLKLGCFVKFNKRIAALHNFTYKITRLAGKDTAEQLNKQHCYNYKLMKVIGLVQLTSGLIFLYNPATSFIFKNELVSLLPIEITFVDQSKLSGFLIANFSMTMMGVYAVLATLFGGLHIYAMILNYSIQVDLIDYDVKHLDAAWSQTKKSTLAYRHSLLRNICQKCQDKDNYIAEMKKIFDQTIYFYFAAVYMSQIICLYEIQMFGIECVNKSNLGIVVVYMFMRRFVILTSAAFLFRAEGKNSWMPGYGIAYGLFIEMLLYCIFGTKTTIVNERLCLVLTQSNWYTYDIYSQKKFLILLNSCMNSQDLWIGPLAPLSVVTGIQILKSIYSYYTFLTEAV